MLFFSLGTLNYGDYLAFLALAIALTVTALAEMRFYQIREEISDLERRLKGYDYDQET